MKRAKLMISGFILSTVLSGWPAVRNAAGADKRIARQPVEGLPGRISEKGPTNGSGQWSADPEKGWVRADKRRQAHESGALLREPKHPSASAKDKRKTN